MAAKKRVSVKTRIGDRKPLTNHKVPKWEKAAFERMVKQMYPAIKGNLSKKLAKCYQHNWHVNAGEKYLSMLNVFKEAMKKPGADKAKIHGYIKSTQSLYVKWRKSHPELKQRRRV